MRRWTDEPMIERRPRTADPLTCSIPEAATALGVDPATLYRLARRGEAPVPVLRIGRALRVSRVQLERFVNGGTEAS